MPFVRRSTLRALRERVDRAEALLAGERTARTATEAALHRAIGTFAEALRMVAPAAAPTGPAPAPAAQREHPAELPTEVKDACATYAFGNVREQLANRRKARALLADGMSPNDVIRTIRQGAVPASREED